jgi:WD40-like Beta Propeller Repeat
MLIPSLGGTPGSWRGCQLDTSEFFSYGWGNVSPLFLVWSSDGRWLLALEQSGLAGLAPERRVQIVRISVESGEKSPFLLSLDADQNWVKGNAPLTSGEETLSVSPDGKKLAFIHTIDNPNTDICVVALNDEMMPTGPARSLHFRKYLVPRHSVGCRWAQRYRFFWPARLNRALESPRQPFRWTFPY